MSDESRFGLGAIREAARKRAAATSLHAIADEIGLSYTGFRAFLAGASPHQATREKLVNWYVEHRSSRGKNSLASEDVMAAVQLLALYIKSAKTKSARERRIREISEEITKLAGKG